jgi:manganese/zinc/iron transport system substrate-binding protein
MRRLVVFALFLLFCSCSKDPSAQQLKEWMKPNGKLKILSTTAMIHDLIKEVGGDQVDALTLIQGDRDPHSYELVKGDDEKFIGAQAVFYNGLGLEHGASLAYRLEHHPLTVGLGSWLESCYPEKILREGNEADPHIWMDVSLWSRTIPVIVETLSRLRPEAALFFKERGKNFQKQMEEADQQIYRILQGIPSEKRYLVTTHDAMSYFTRHYLAEKGEVNWKERFSAPEGLAPDGQISLEDISRIIDFLCLRGVHFLFAESNVNRSSLQKIIEVCQSKGLEVSLAKQSLYTDAMGPLAHTYLEMMFYNASILLKYLGQL